MEAMQQRKRNAMHTNQLGICMHVRLIQYCAVVITVQAGRTITSPPIQQHVLRVSDGESEVNMG